MKRTIYTLGLVASALGFVLSAGVLAATLAGRDPSLAAPWLWRLREGALATWGLMFLAPGIFALREKPDAPAEPPRDPRARRLAQACIAVLLLVAAVNFTFVMQARTDVMATSAQARAEQYELSRLYSLRTYAGFWLVLYGVPLTGFALLNRELAQK